MVTFSVSGVISNAGIIGVGIGIAKECTNSSILACAIGNVSSVRLYPRIVERAGKTSTLEKNVSIDNNPSREGGVKDGETIPAALFNQRYFEHTLGWDFAHVWEWDVKKNRPTLRPFKAGDTSTNGNQGNATDALAKQVQANIWL